MCVYLVERRACVGRICDRGRGGRALQAATDFSLAHSSCSPPYAEAHEKATVSGDKGMTAHSESAGRFPPDRS